MRYMIVASIIYSTVGGIQNGVVAQLVAVEV